MTHAAIMINVEEGRRRLLTSKARANMFLSPCFSRARRAHYGRGGQRKVPGKFAHCSINKQFSETKNYPSLLEPPADILPEDIPPPSGARAARSFLLLSQPFLIRPPPHAHTNRRGNKITNGTNRARSWSPENFSTVPLQQRGPGIGRAVHRKSKVSHLERRRICIQ